MWLMARPPRGRARSLQVLATCPATWSVTLVLSLVSTSLCQTPPPPPTAAVLPPEVFAAGTMIVTQESLNLAPQKYPTIIEQLNLAAANATNSPITPYSVNSSTLVSVPIPSRDV
jgi:hypothetical protein